MTDVRLTATNPEDSSVVPVACNAKGELKLEEPTINSDDYVAKVGDNMTGALTIGPDGGPAVTTLADNGSAEFAGGNLDISANGFIDITSPYGGAQDSFRLRDNNSVVTTTLSSDGSAEFAGDVVVGSRNKQWMIVESGGIAHLVEQTTFAAGSAAQYPELRNIPQELDLVEQALSEVMEKLRMSPPAGWPVWDGSDEN